MSGGSDDPVFSELLIEGAAAVTLGDQQRGEQTSADNQGRDCNQQFAFKAFQAHGFSRSIRLVFPPSTGWTHTILPGAL